MCIRDRILGKMVAAIVVVLLIVIFTCCSRPYTAEHATTGETVRDGRFIAYDNGTVLDTRTKLMWAAKDNGSDINLSLIHISEPTRLGMISYAVFCLKK